MWAPPAIVAAQRDASGALDEQTISSLCCRGAPRAGPAAGHLPRLLHGVPRPIANVAAPVIGRDLGPSLTGVQWVVDGYSVVFAGRLRTGGALGNRFGARRVFLAVVCVQSGASFGCKVAWNMLLVNGFRLLQGTRAACSCRAR